MKAFGAGQGFYLLTPLHKQWVLSSSLPLWTGHAPPGSFPADGDMQCQTFTPQPHKERTDCSPDRLEMRRQALVTLTCFCSLCFLVISFFFIHLFVIKL